MQVLLCPGFKKEVASMNNNTDTTTNNIFTSEETAQRVSLLEQLLQCNSRIIVSRYNLSGALMNTNTSNSIYDTMLRYSKRLDDAIAFGKTNSCPIVITSDYGLIWSVVFESDENGQPAFLHILGPVLTSPMSESTLNDLLKNPDIRVKWKPKLVSYIRDIKVIPATEFFKDTLMLHYCVTGIYLKPSDITFLKYNEESEEGEKSIRGNYADFWALENSMTDFIRNGDIHYKEKIPSASSVLNAFQPLWDVSDSDARTLATIFCGLCIRAAIDGGLSPDTAYTKSNIYLKNLSGTVTVAEVMNICNNLFEDLLFQVHNHAAKPEYSMEITSCIDYIETHTDDPLSIDTLSSRIGYSKYYLSKKFKAEVGMSVNSYIKKARIDRACFLLMSTDMDIDDISAMLRFGNRNFFTKVFKEETGSTPARFRDEHKRL